MSRNWKNSKEARDYTRKHWGIKPARVVNWDDPLLPARLAEMGRLTELHVFQPHRRKKDVIKIRDDRVNGNYVAWDPRHPHQRLYLLTGKQERQGAKKRFWNPRGKMFTLRGLAQIAGGHHGAGYPNIPVQPVGVLTHITYLTMKRGDVEEDGGKAGLYIHTLGDEGGQVPILAVDGQGRMWVAGGSYTVEDGGIAD